MFVDPAVVDQLYTTLKSHDTWLLIALFDKRFAHPLDELPMRVKDQTGEALPQRRVDDLVERGWFPVCQASPDGVPVPGFPLYAPERVGLYLALERSGYSQAELRVLAAYEEGLIDQIATVDDLTYEDDDLEQLRRHTREIIASMEDNLRYHGGHGGEDHEQTRVRLERQRQHLCHLESLSLASVSADKRERIARSAFRVRMLNESIRSQIIEATRDKIRAWFSPVVAFKSVRWAAGTGHKFDGVLWSATIEGNPGVHDDIERVGLRVPGFVLSVSGATMTAPTIPSKYERAWKEYDLETYFSIVVGVRGGAVCVQCLAPLPQPHTARRTYCSQPCRNAAKQKRYRARNPEAVHDTQQRYYTSLAKLVQ